jgi:hypothetical protein
MLRSTSLAGVFLLAWGTAPSAQPADEGVPLFNGRDLSGWVNVNCAPDTFTVRDGEIHSTGKPICALRTEKMYENFVLDLEYQHLNPGGNAGLFVWADPLPAVGQPFLRAIEVQILDGRNTDNYTSHGDVFSIHGARFTPDRPHPNGWERSLPRERRARPAGQWNHYRVTARDGRISLAVNGVEVSGGTDSRPRKGYLALEAEEAPTRFRNIRIRELPSSGPLAEDLVARADEGFVSIYSGTSLAGWRAAPGWESKDWVLARSTPAAGGRLLLSERDYGDIVVMADWRVRPLAAGVATPPGEEAPANRPVRARIGPDASAAPGERWTRSVLTIRGSTVTEVVGGKTVRDRVVVAGLAARGSIALDAGPHNVEFANIFVRPLEPATKP